MKYDTLTVSHRYLTGRPVGEKLAAFISEFYCTCHQHTCNCDPTWAFQILKTNTGFVSQHFQVVQDALAHFPRHNDDL